MLSRKMISSHLLERCRWRLAVVVAAVLVLAAEVARAQSISGTVLDPSGAVVPNAKVEIHNPVSGYDRSTVTDPAGKFSFSNVPFNPYHMTVTAEKFTPYAQDVEVRSGVPVSVNITLQIPGTQTEITVEAAQDLIENDPTFHTDVDKSLVGQLSGHPRFPGNCRRLKRALPWPGRSRREFVFGRWTADYRPAEQGIFQPDSA
jgi:hypothetical protein